MTTPQRRGPLNAADRPAHPKWPAIVLMVAVTVGIVFLAWLGVR
jgi:hypothetical protein